VSAGRRSRRFRGAADGVALGICLLLACLLGACATIEPPQGGPVDRTPPSVLAVSPDSGAVGLDGLSELEIIFSEKVNPQPAIRFLHLYPPLEYGATKWHGRRRVTVELREPLPPDTVIVVEIPRGYSDVHRVESRLSLRYPLATADSLPSGRITGRLRFEDEPAAGAVIELYPVPPDTLEYFRQDFLRRAETDSTGDFVLPWLATPGGPYLLRAFLDRNGDLRPADNEPQRLLPVEITLTTESPTADAGTHILYGPQAPGRLLGLAGASEADARHLFGWTQKIAEGDTGFAPQHLKTPPPGQAPVAPGDTTVFDPAGPGTIRAILFADLDGDSLLSALPDSSAVPDTVLWRWEPHVTAEPLEIAPGLDLVAPLPAVPDTLTSCPTPPPARASRDTAAVVPDLPDSTRSPEGGLE